MIKLTQDTIRAYIAHLERKGYDRSTIVRKLNSSLKYVDWAYHNDLLPYNSFQQVKDEIAKELEQRAGTATNNVIHKATNHQAPPSIPQDKQNPFELKPQHFLGLALGVIMLAVLGAGIYQRFFEQTVRSLAYPSVPAAAGRVLSFQGRLTDSLGNPINTATNMRFRLYDAVTAGTTLYDTGTCSITPDPDGIHNVLIGEDCGTEISNDVFTENTAVWLGVTVGSDAEMDPRQQIANVPYAINAETLQGLPVGTNVSNIPYINDAGDLLMAAAGPQIGSTYASETFVVSSANAITIQSAGSGDVTLTATESGTIKFLTGGSQAASFNNNGDLIMANGNQIQLGNLASDPTAIGDGSLYYNTTDDKVYYYNGTAWTEMGAGGGGDSLWQVNLAALSPAISTYDVLVGGTATGSALVRLPGTANENGFFNSGGNFGIGTTGPDRRLDVLDASNPQMRLSQADGTVYSDFQTDGSGNLTVTTTGSTVTFSGDTVAASDFSCTDCLDFTELEDTLDLDAALILNQGSNTWTQNFTGTTTTGYTYNADSLTTGIGSLYSFDALTSGAGISLTSTSTALTSGQLLSLDWSPGSTTTATGDLFRLNIGANGNVTNLFNITDNGTSVFRVAENGIESAVPHSFTAAGDVSIAYDLLFSNQTASYIKSNAPLTIEAGESFESNDLTLKTYNSGDVILDAGGTTTATGTVGFYDSNVKAATVTTPIEFADAATSINTYRTNFTNESLIGALNEAYSAATGGGAGSVWTDSGTNIYLTTTTDELVIGGTTSLSSAKLSLDGDADQIQLIVQGNGTQTTSLAVFENSAGTDQFTISNTGDIVNAGNATLGDASGDTVTANAAAWTFANDTTVALSGGVNGLNIDSNTLSVDATNDRIGIGTSAPDGKLHVTGASVGKALAIFNETGDQNILVASDSGTGVFSIGQNGDMSRLESDAISGLPDSGSIVPNSSFELDNNANSYPDGWTESSAAQTTYMTTGGGHGEKYMSINNGGTYYVYSKCIPISSNQTYHMSARARNNVGADNMIRIRIVEYATRANCQSASSTTGTATTGTQSVGANWGAVGGAAGTTAATSRWGSVEVVNVGSLYPLEVDGISIVPSTTTSGLDLAETYPASASDNIQIGEIVSFGTNAVKQDGADVQNINRSSTAYDKNAFGVIATKPGLILDDEKSYEKVQVALKGRVPVLVTTENGPIRVGDPITSSSVPGVGMKATRSGRIVGYAMTEWTSDDPTEIDQVTLFVNPESYSAPMPGILTDSETYDGVISQVADNNEDANFKLTNAAGEIIDSALGVGKLITAEIKAGFISAQKLAVEIVTAGVVETRELFAEVINAGSITSKTITTDTLDSSSITANSITTDSITSDSLIAKDATISGKLVAEEVDSQNIRDLRQRIEEAVERETSTTEEQQAQFSSLLGNVEDIQSYITTMEQSPSTTSDATYQEPPEDVSLTTGTSAIVGNLIVTDKTEMYSGMVLGNFTIGDISIENDQILALTDELKLNALERINLLDGAVMIARDGTIKARGEVIAERGIRANSIRGINDGDDIAIQNSRLKIQDALGKEVASINASGSALFADLSLTRDTNATGSSTIIAATENFATNGIFAPAIITNAASAGDAILPKNEDELVIFSNKITSDSLIYVTATSPTQNKSLYVASTHACPTISPIISPSLSPTPSPAPCKSYFKVAVDSSISSDITFNWWIVN